MQPVATGYLDETGAVACPERVVHGCGVAHDVRAPAIGNGGSSIACTTVTRLGAAAPSTMPIDAVAASRGTWLQRSTQPSQPVPRAASRT